MKVLIDAIPTGTLNRCASTVKMVECYKTLKSSYPNLFFYWLVPSGTTEEEYAWLPKDPAIKYIEVPTKEDRNKEYWSVSDPWMKLFSFSVGLWDVDLVITNRTHQVPFMRWAMSKGLPPRGRKIVIIEDMPLLSFKKMCYVSGGDRNANLSALNGYAQADLVLNPSFWEKQHVLSLAKNFYSPSLVKDLAGKFIECLPKRIVDTHYKSRATIEALMNKERKFTLSYAGRMVNRDSVTEAFDVMTKHFIMGGDDIRIVLCTVSKDFGRVKHDLIEHLEVHRPDREEFWRIMREESDVGVFMSKDEDLSMSMLEPIIQGTPLVVYRAEHALKTLGDQYPFYVSGVQEGYALVKAFKDNYGAMYKKFVDWKQEYFVPLMTQRSEKILPDYLTEVMAGWEADMTNFYQSMPANEIVRLIHAEGVVGKFKINDVIETLCAKKLVDSPLAKKSTESFNEGLRLTFDTEFNGFRAGLMQLGYVDAGCETGEMVKV